MPICPSCNELSIDSGEDCYRCRAFAALVFGKNRSVTVVQRSYGDDGDDFSQTEISYKIPQTIDEDIIPFLVRNTARNVGNDSLVPGLCEIKRVPRFVILNLVVIY